ncbi:STY0301 family protein [Roseomonas sp. CAU 1739]|uniref:STY0301 family protein n=1 Tax=Roseomonas sp. CAU 1739 TaxID=3140364 RepID=UPI00325A45CC
MRRIAFVFLLLPGVAGAADIACPDAITTPLAAMPGWMVDAHPSPTGFPYRGPDVPGRKAFEGVTIVDGGPGDLRAEAPGSLVPDESAAQGGMLRQRWDISQGSPRGFLMVCRYQGTATVLGRVLPASARECVQMLPQRDTRRALSALCR